MKKEPFLIGARKLLRITILAATALLLLLVWSFARHPQVGDIGPIPATVMLVTFAVLWFWLKRRLFPR